MDRDPKRYNRRHMLKWTRNGLLYGLAGKYTYDFGSEYIKHNFGFDIKERLEKEDQKEVKDSIKRDINLIEQTYGVKILVPNTIKILRDGVYGHEYTFSSEISNILIMDALRLIIKAFAIFPPKTYREYVESIIISGKISIKNFSLG